MIIKNKGTFKIKAEFPKYMFNDTFFSLGLVLENEFGNQSVFYDIIYYSINDLKQTKDNNSIYTGPIKTVLKWEIIEL